RNHGRYIGIKESVVVDEGRHFFTGCYRSPFLRVSFARQCEVKAEVGGRVVAGVFGDFRKPRTGNHEASGGYHPARECPQGRRVLGVGDTNVVSMDNKQLGSRRVTQSLRKTCLLRLRGKNRCQRKQQGQYSLHIKSLLSEIPGRPS